MPSLSIKINAKLFNALPIEDQSKITEIMKQTNLLDKQGSIVADSEAPEAQAQGFFDDFIDRVNPCKIACDVGASAAAAACIAGTAGAGLAVCLAVAAAAHQACKDAC